MLNFMKEWGAVGVLLFAGAILLVGSFAFDKADVEPVEEVYKAVGSPLDGPGVCPSGFNYLFTADPSPARKCTSNPFVVILYPDNDNCNLVFDTAGRGEIPCSTLVEEGVWPASRVGQ